MCFHLSLSQKAVNLENRYKSKFEQGYEQIFHANAFTLPNYPVVSTENHSTFQFYSWGLKPSWAKDDKIRTKTINARSETVFEKPSFRNSIMRKRCLVPVTGFFENQTVGKEKFPYIIKLKSEEIFSLGGIWSEWTDKTTGEILKSFSILTITANELMSEIHNLKKRMPLILNKTDEEKWIDLNLKRNELEQLFKPYKSDDMKAHRVSKDLNKPRIYTNKVEILNEITNESGMF